MGAGDPLGKGKEWKKKGCSSLGPDGSEFCLAGPLAAWEHVGLWRGEAAMGLAEQTLLEARSWILGKWGN